MGGVGLLNERRGAGLPTVYLDVDGVVTTAGYQRQAGKDRLNPDQVAIVAALVREFDARVVVSSTWRIADCRPTLVEAGLPENCFHPDWRTAILPTSRDAETGGMLPAERAGRGDEIAEHAPRPCGPARPARCRAWALRIGWYLGPASPGRDGSGSTDVASGQLIHGTR